MPPLVATVTVNIGGVNYDAGTINLAPPILPSFTLRDNLYNSETIQWKKKLRPLEILVVFGIIGACLGLASRPYSIPGTIVWVAFMALETIYHLVFVFTHYMRRKKALGMGSLAKTEGYSLIPSLLTVIWFLIPAFVAFVMFASVANSPFTGEKGRGGTKVAAFCIAIIAIIFISGPMTAAIITMQSGFTYNNDRVVLPDLVMSHNPGGGTMMITDMLAFNFADIESMAAATSSESFKTVRTHTSGNTKITTTRTWTRNVLWICFRLRGQDSIYGVPVSATPPPGCGGYCCLSLERLQERGVIKTTASNFLLALSTKRPDLTPQTQELKRLIDSTVIITA